MLGNLIKSSAPALFFVVLNPNIRHNEPPTVAATLLGKDGGSGGRLAAREKRERDVRNCTMNQDSPLLSGKVLWHGKSCARDFKGGRDKRSTHYFQLGASLPAVL